MSPAARRRSAVVREMVRAQCALDLRSKIAVDLFAGGGGASLGYELATGRQVDIAVNHDAAAIALHAANHPDTHHVTSDVFEVDPREVTKGRPVGILWASPDCTFHSKARGAKPFRSKETKRRALAWVVTRWAGQVSPDVILLENVEEFAFWGPLVGPPDAQRPCPRRRGRTFRTWKRSLIRLGYRVEHREQRACDYGDPTIRKRLFVIARRDGQPIVWPEPTHGPGLLPYRTAAECIDWSIPMLSIFATKEEAKAWGKAHGQASPKRPLVAATMRRVARGVVRFVLRNPKPFLVTIAHGEESPSGVKRWGKADRSLDDPYPTITTSPNQHGLIAPFLVPRYGEREGQEPRSRSVEQPAPVVVPTGNGASLVGAFLAKHYGGHETPGAPLGEPISTVTTQDHHHLVAASLTKLRGTSSDADPAEPLHTISAGGKHHGVVAAHLSTYYGGPGGEERGQDPGEPIRTQGTENRFALVYAFMQSYYGQGVGQKLSAPARTITTKDRLGLVTVTVDGTTYYIADIGMRMLQPRELYNCQGFPPDYQIQVRFYDAKKEKWRQLTKTEQVRQVGNSVCPGHAAALIRANCPELVADPGVPRRWRIAA